MPELMIVFWNVVNMVCLLLCKRKHLRACLSHTLPLNIQTEYKGLLVYFLRYNHLRLDSPLFFFFSCIVSCILLLCLFIIIICFLSIRPLVFYGVLRKLELFTSAHPRLVPPIYLPEPHPFSCEGNNARLSCLYFTVMYL